MVATYRALADLYLPGSISIDAGTTFTAPDGWIPSTGAVDPMTTDAIQAYWNAGPMGLDNADPSRNLTPGFFSTVAPPKCYWARDSSYTRDYPAFILKGGGESLGIRKPEPLFITAPPIPPGPGGPISSAGVFDTTGKLVRTIWSGETNNPNVNNPALAWNGALDDGSVAPTGNYTIKVVSHGISYVWDITNGAIGNSSTGPWGAPASNNIWNPGTGPYQFAITTAGQIWTTLGYNEKYTNLAISSRSNIRSMTYWTQSGVTDMTTPTNTQRDAVTDDTRVYVNLGAGGASGTGVYVIDIASNLMVNFGGTVIGSFSVIGFDNTANQFIAGLAVQRTGSYLFIARPDANTVATLNKTTGATLHTFALTNATQLACNPTSATQLWAVSNGNTIINKLTVDGAGNLSASGVTITASKIGAIDVSPDGTRLLVAYSMAQTNSGLDQIKAYHTSDGSPDTTWANSGVLGTLNGYNLTSVVDNTTFHFAEMSSFGGGSEVFISYDPSDGSFWIGDQGDYRALHFSSGNSPAYIEAIYWRGGFYACYPCMNDPTKVAAGWDVYTSDFSHPLQYGNGSWTLSNNYGGFQFGGMYDKFQAMKFYIKGSNGRYYATAANPGVRTILSLDEPGVAWRDTNVHFENDTYVDHNFNLWVRSSITPDGVTSCTIRRNLFTGFDGSNNPTWAMAPIPNTAWPVYLTFTPPANFPLTGGDNNFYWPEEVLSNGVIPMYDPSQNSHNHLGGVDSVTGQVKFSTMPLVPSNYGSVNSDLYIFPEAPFFDRIPTNAGGQLFAKAGENHFFTQFRGEQTNGGQTNVISHWHETGLLLSRFGTAAPIFGMTGQINPTGTTPPGNINSYKGMFGLTGNSVWGGAEKDTNTGIWYLYESDEWYQGGVTRWSIHDVSTIRVDSHSVSWNSASYPANVDPTDLLYGLTYNSTVVDGVAGWHRSSADVPGSPGADQFLCKSNIDNCSRTSPSLSIYFNMNTAGLTGQTYRDIPRVLAGNWQINAIIAIFHSNVAGGIYIYTEVIDNAGKVLVRIWEDLQAGPTATLLVNGSPITPYVSSIDSYAIAENRTPLTIAGNVGTGKITVTWSSHNYTITVSPMDAGGNVAAPAKFQYNYHQGIGAGSGSSAALFSLHYTES